MSDVLSAPPDVEPEAAPDAKSVSFQTASGKAVNFSASAKAKPRSKKAKVVVETPVEADAPETGPDVAQPEAAAADVVVPPAQAEESQTLLPRAPLVR